VQRALKLSFWALIIAVMASPSQAADPAWLSKASPWLLHQYEMNQAQAKYPKILVYMKAHASFAHIKTTSERTKRTKAVFSALTQTAKTSQADLVAWLDSKKLKYRSYYVSNMIAVDQVSKAHFNQILQRPDVLRVVGNPRIRNALPSSTSQSLNSPKGPGQNLIRIGAPRVWDEFKNRGENIIVAGQDTGVRWDHKALLPHYRGWNGVTADHSYSWHDAVHQSIGGASSCGYDLDTPCDDHDHGTHTIGTIVGDDYAGNQIGVAPGARWIGCRNMDGGIGNPETYTECFQWFLAPWPQRGDPVEDARPELAPHVINNSWGCPRSEGCDGTEFERILSAMKAAGIFVVASAGNEGSGCASIMSGPAFHTDLLMSVGAINHRDDAIAAFSSRGPSTFDNQIGPHVSAPGVDVRSAVRSGGYSEFGWSGTSMAGPHIAGMVALLWSVEPKLIGQIDETHRRITATAEGKFSTQNCGGTPGSARPNNTFGHGIADVYEAIRVSHSRVLP
jgi:serine protease AprX